MFIAEIPLNSADFTLHHLALELSLIQSHLFWGEFNAFSATDVIHNSPIFIPPGIQHCWVDRGA